MRSLASRTVYGTMAALGVPGLARKMLHGAPLFCFHNVVAAADAGRGDASLHMSVGTFEAVVRWMTASYDVVRVGELVDRAEAGESLRGLAAISFDDAYRGVFDHALPILAAAEVPATIFVVPGFADRPTPTWWDTLGTRGLLTEERRSQALTKERGLTAEVLRPDDVDASVDSLPEALLPAPWDQITQAVGDGVELGSHTDRHPNLTALSQAEVLVELRRSRQAIRDQVGQEPQALAFPYGLWNASVLRATRQAGYRIGLTLEGHLVAAGQAPLAIPRINVPASISTNALACWAVGVRPRRPR